MKMNNSKAIADFSVEYTSDPKDLHHYFELSYSAVFRPIGFMALGFCLPSLFKSLVSGWLVMFFMLALIPLVLLIRPLFVRFLSLIAHIIKRKNGAMKHKKIVVSTEGVTQSSSGLSTTIDFSADHTYIYNEHGLLVYSGKSAISFCPRRILTADQWKLLMQLVTSNYKPIGISKKQLLKSFIVGLLLSLLFEVFFIFDGEGTSLFTG